MILESQLSEVFKFRSLLAGVDKGQIDFLVLCKEHLHTLKHRVDFDCRVSYVHLRERENLTMENWLIRYICIIFYLKKKIDKLCYPHFPVELAADVLETLDQKGVPQIVVPDHHDF